MTFALSSALFDTFLMCCSLLPFKVHEIALVQTEDFLFIFIVVFALVR